jgi:ribosomal protein S18 acetylase RimI-like enzyme
MIFETLNESAGRGELILVDGGLCHWHLRRDGQITIREIIVLPEVRGRGVGRKMLQELMSVSSASSIFAKCPADLPANGWYEAIGFEDEGKEITRSGRDLRLWRLRL